MNTYDQDVAILKDYLATTDNQNVKDALERILDRGSLVP